MLQDGWLLWRTTWRQHWAFLIPLSHYRQYVPWLEVFLIGGTTSSSPHFGWVLHTTGRWPLIGQSILTINNSRKTALQTLVTEKKHQLTFGSHHTNTWRNDQYLNSPYVTVLHRKMTESQPYVDRGPHPLLP